MTQQPQHEDASTADPCPAIGLFRCLVCEQLTYPAAAYGCSRCGAPREHGEEVYRPARGDLLNWVTVHVDMVPGLKAPYVVGEVRLAPGVVEQVLMDVSCEAQLSIGQPVRGIADGAAQVTEGKPALRFIPATAWRGAGQ